MLVRILSGGGFALVLALALGSIGSAGITDLRLSYILLILALIFGCSLIMLSPIANIYSKYQIITKLVICTLLAFFLYFIANFDTNRSYAATHIVPDTIPTPQSVCGNSDDSYKVFLGTVVAATKLPLETIIAFGAFPDGEPYPALKIVEYNGGIRIAILRIFGENGKILVRINDDKPWESSDIRVERPDSHTLIVYDDRDREVLFMHFLNPKAIEVRGIFRRPDVGVMRVDKDGVKIGNFRISETCLHDAREVFKFGDHPPPGTSQ